MGSAGGMSTGMAPCAASAPPCTASGSRAGRRHHHRAASRLSVRAGVKETEDEVLTTPLLLNEVCITPS